MEHCVAEHAAQQHGACVVRGARAHHGAAAAAPLNRSAPFLWHTYVAVDFAPDTLNNIASIQANVEYGAFLDSPRKSYFIRVWYYESIRSLSVVSKAAKVAVGERIAVTATIEAYNTVQMSIASLDSSAAAQLSLKMGPRATKLSVALEQSNVAQCAQFPAAKRLQWRNIQTPGAPAWFVFEHASPACNMSASVGGSDEINLNWNPTL